MQPDPTIQVSDADQIELKEIAYEPIISSVEQLLQRRDEEQLPVINW